MRMTDYPGLANLWPHLWPDVRSALTPSGPSTISIQSLIDHQLLGLVLRALLQRQSLHDSLTQQSATLMIDCSEIREPKHLYDRILNGFSQWNLLFSNTIQGVPNWTLIDGTPIQPGKSRRRSEEVDEDLPSKGVLGDHANFSFPTFSASLEHLADTTGRKAIILLHSERLNSLADKFEVDLLAELARLAQRPESNVVVICVADTLSTSFGSDLASHAPPTLQDQVGALHREDALALLFHHWNGSNAEGDERANGDKVPLQPQSALAEHRVSAEMQRSLGHSLADQVWQATTRLLTPRDGLRAMSTILDGLWDDFLRSDSAIAGTLNQQQRRGQLMTAVKAPLTEQIDGLYKLSVRSKTNALSLANGLPTVGKIALLACFLACWIPSRLDARLFGTFDGQRRRRAKRRRTDPSRLSILAGPKAASLQRIEALWECLCLQISVSGRHSVDEEKDHHSHLSTSDSDFYAQMAKLINANLIARVGQDRLDNIKLKALLDRQEAVALGGRLGFNVEEWLEGPA